MTKNLRRWTGREFAASVPIFSTILIRNLLLILQIILVTTFGYGQSRLAGNRNSTKRFHFSNTISESPLTVFYFNSPECPVCKSSIASLGPTVQTLDSLQVPLYFVYHSYLANKSKLRRFHKMNLTGVPLTQIILDPDMMLVKQLNATVTPEVFLVGRDGTVVYSGMLNNMFEAIGVKRAVVTEEYLVDAVMKSLAGQTNSSTRTVPVGCIIPRNR